MKINQLVYRYTLNELYPYDLDINFTLTIPDPVEFMESVDQYSIKKEIDELTAISNNIPTSRIMDPRLRRLERLTNLDKLYKEFLDGTNNKIELDLYRLIVLKTEATFNVFSLSMNILRLIGGYGALAYSGNN